MSEGPGTTSTRSASSGGGGEKTAGLSRNNVPWEQSSRKPKILEKVSPPGRGILGQSLPEHSKTNRDSGFPGQIIPYGAQLHNLSLYGISLHFALFISPKTVRGVLLHRYPIHKQYISWIVNNSFNKSSGGRVAVTEHFTGSRLTDRHSPIGFRISGSRRRKHDLAVAGRSRVGRSIYAKDVLV